MSLQQVDMFPIATISISMKHEMFGRIWNEP